MLYADISNSNTSTIRWSAKTLPLQFFIRDMEGGSQIILSMAEDRAYMEKYYIY